jgi:hypothetical protein
MLTFAVRFKAFMRKIKKNGTRDTKHTMNVVFSRALGHRHVDLGGLDSAIKERESPIYML